MKIKLTEEDLKGWIKRYYHKYYRAEVDPKISCKEETVGYIHESKSAVVKISVDLEVSIAGQKQMMEKVLTDEDLKEICSSTCEEANITLDSLEYDAGLEYRGYGVGEYQEAVFRRLDLNVHGNVLKKVR